VLFRSHLSTTNMYFRNKLVSNAAKALLSKSVRSSVPSLLSFSTLPTRLNAPLAHIAQVRHFSGDANADLNLSQILTEEILEETTRKEEEIDEDYEDVKKYIESTFKLTEKVGYGEVKLFRKFNDEEIHVKFDCQDEAEDSENNQEGINEDQQHEPSEDDAEPIDSSKVGINFEVTISKKNGKAVFHCIATHQQPTIVHLSFLPPGTSSEDHTLYNGPRFEDLDPAVQGAFQHYLAERGIDEDLSFFVLTHSRYKEEKEYLNWLKTLSDFVN